MTETTVGRHRAIDQPRIRFSRNRDLKPMRRRSSRQPGRLRTWVTGWWFEWRMDWGNDRLYYVGMFVVVAVFAAFGLFGTAAYLAGWRP